MGKGKYLHQCKAVKSNKRSKTMDKNKANEADISLKTEKQYKRGEHPKSQANLQPFEKGISGNPGGRSLKYEQLKKALIKYGEKPVDGWALNLTYRESVLNQIWFQASEGSIGHIKILAELGCLDEENS